MDFGSGMRPGRQTTLDDVARHACVSPKTVSRVMNGEPNVREATRERVAEAARELGYRPNPAARSLAASRSFLVGHLQDNPNREYLGRANDGIYEACRERGYYLLPEPVDHTSPDCLARIERFVDSSGVDGVILTPPLCDDPRILEMLRAREVPFVLISPLASDPDVPQVRMHQKEAGRQMTQHLISLGHKRIAFVAGPPSHMAATERRVGFEAALKEAGLDPADCPVVTADFSFRAGLEAAEPLLSLARRPTAVFAASDIIAAGVMNCAVTKGLSVPDDLSVAGFDATEMGRALWPSLTTIRQPIERMTACAARYLMTRDEDRGPPLRQQFGFEIILGGSTGQAPGG